MLLSELNGYFARHKRVCMADLVNHFNSQPEALRGMLDMLVAKKRIKRVAVQMDCGACSKCDPKLLEIYEWAGDD